MIRGERQAQKLYPDLDCHFINFTTCLGLYRAIKVVENKSVGLFNLLSFNQFFTLFALQTLSNKTSPVVGRFVGFSLARKFFPFF